jgi:hypothetical protein
MRKERTMTTMPVLARGLAAVIAAAAIAIGGAEAAGFFKEATDFEYEGDATEIAATRRSLPNGKTDAIKAMGYTKWGDIELR